MANIQFVDDLTDIVVWEKTFDSMFVDSWSATIPESSSINFREHCVTWDWDLNSEAGLITEMQFWFECATGNPIPTKIPIKHEFIDLFWGGNADDVTKHAGNEQDRFIVDCTTSNSIQCGLVIPSYAKYITMVAQITAGSFSGSPDNLLTVRLTRKAK